MLKRFFKNLSRSFCIYLLTALNLIHAIQRNSFDWLMWASLLLTVVAITLDLITAAKEGCCNADA